MAAKNSKQPAPKMAMKGEHMMPGMPPKGMPPKKMKKGKGC